jgi:Cys-tRNA(Pro)/Cys-tRNA(Cys) deacylase
MRPVKTLAMRVLEAHGVPYEPRYYEAPEHLSASEVAAVLGLPPEQVFKTLVVLPARPGGKPLLALVPGNCQLALRRLEAASGEKRLTMAPHLEAERLTGLEKGGISPLALMEKGWRVFVDETVTLFDRVEVSAGRVGVGVLVPVEGLLATTHASIADIAEAA